MEIYQVLDENRDGLIDSEEFVEKFNVVGDLLSASYLKQQEHNSKGIIESKLNELSEKQKISMLENLPMVIKFKKELKISQNLESYGTSFVNNKDLNMFQKVNSLKMKEHIPLQLLVNFHSKSKRNIKSINHQNLDSSTSNLDNSKDNLEQTESQMVKEEPSKLTDFFKIKVIETEKDEEEEELHKKLSVDNTSRETGNLMFSKKGLENYNYNYVSIDQFDNNEPSKESFSKFNEKSQSSTGILSDYITKYQDDDETLKFKKLLKKYDYFSLSDKNSFFESISAETLKYVMHLASIEKKKINNISYYLQDFLNNAKRNIHEKKIFNEDNDLFMQKQSIEKRLILANYKSNHQHFYSSNIFFCYVIKFFS